MKAWLFQDHRQKQKHGDDAPWSVGWIDPDGKRRSKKIGSRTRAERFQRKIEGQLAAGTYETTTRKQWAAFRDEFNHNIGAGMNPDTRAATTYALDRFQEVIRPGRVDTIKTATIDGFIAKRRNARGLKPGTKISPASINKELRHLKAVLRIAHEWGYLPQVPKIRMIKEPGKLPRYVTPEHFAAMYQACDVATQPDDQPYPAADWWRALLAFLYMTGWRIGEPLALRRQDVDLEAGRAITRAADNKGKRDEIVPLHPVVVDHLQKLVAFGGRVFPWNRSRRAIYDEFHKIQEAASIRLPCSANHEHRRPCPPDCQKKHKHSQGCPPDRYGFHDLRRAFATQNAERLTADALQHLMRHKNYTTTQRYINMARQLNTAVESLEVPDVLKAVKLA